MGVRIGPLEPLFVLSPALTGSSPWERYKSGAHSFPDYGWASPGLIARLSVLTDAFSRTEGVRMGPTFLVRTSRGLHTQYRRLTIFSQKAITASAGPVNTLGSRRSSSDVYVVTDSPPTKRQRPDSSRTHGSAKSHFFLGSKPAAHEDVLDLTRSVSRDDQCDLKSSSSTGNTASSTAAIISEFRNARPKPSSHPGRRKRKSRLPSETDNIARAVTPKGSSLATKTAGQDSRSGAVDSPDILAIDEHPPPANIGSDIQPRAPAKRMLHLCQTESTGPPVKRPKPTQASKESIEGSEDELNAQPDKTEMKKKSNFSSLTQPRQQIDAGSDIRSSIFGGFRRLLGPSLPTRSRMVLKKAACGKDLYENDGQGLRQIILCPETKNSSKLVPMTASGDRLQLAWLNIDTKAAFRVLHAATASPCVIISRSKTVDFEAKLALEFETPQGASELISIMDSDKAEEKSK